MKVEIGSFPRFFVCAVRRVFVPQVHCDCDMSAHGCFSFCVAVLFEHNNIMPLILVNLLSFYFEYVT